jgi:hypothetical protein
LAEKLSHHSGLNTAKLFKDLCFSTWWSLTTIMWAVTIKMWHSRHKFGDGLEKFAWYGCIKKFQSGLKSGIS